MPWAPPEAEQDTQAWTPPEAIESTPPSTAAAPEPSGGLELGKLLGKAQDIGKQALGDILPPEIMTSVFGGTSSSVRPEEQAGPIIPLDVSKQIVGELPAWAGGETRLGRGLSTGAATALSEVSKPSAIAQLPAFAVPGVAEVFAANAIAELPKQYQGIRDIVKEHGINSVETGEALAQAGLTDLMAILAGAHGTGGKAVRAEAAIRPSLSEVFNRTPGLAEPTVEATAPAEVRAPVEPVAVAPPVVEAPPVRPNQPVAPTGESSIAQGDLDALRRSNETRLANASAPLGEEPLMPRGTEPQVVSTAYIAEDGSVKLPPQFAPFIAHEGVSTFHEEAAPAETQRGFWGVKTPGGPVEFLTREEAAKIAVENGQAPPGTTALKSENFQASGEPLFKGPRQPPTTETTPTEPVPPPVVETPPPPVKPPRTFKQRPPADSFGSESTPVAAALINDLGGLKSKSTAIREGKFKGNEDLWNGAQDVLHHPTHAKIYSYHSQALLDKAGNTKMRKIGKGGLMPDEAAQALYDAGLIKEATPDAMWDALRSESKSARTEVATQRSAKLSEAEATKQATDFEKAVTDTSKPRVEPQDLAVGDTVTIADEPFKVIEVDPDTFDVTLEDGKKFGVQTVQDGDIIYGEHESPATEAPTTFAPEPAPTQPTVPTLRAGETQGDLLSKQTEDLTLAGEKGTDFGKQAEEKAAADAAAEDARRFQEEQQTQFDELMSPGPGAAASGEPLASYELRRFGKRFQEDQSIAPEIRDKTGNQYYEPISNKITLAEAEAIIEERGTDASARLVRDETFDMPPRVRVTLGEALIKKLNQSFQEAKAAGDVRAGEFLEQAVDTAEYLSELGTTLGQGVQAFAIWNKLSPEGIMLEAQRIVGKTGRKLTPEEIAKIGELTAEVEKAPEGFQKVEKTMDLTSYLADIKGIDPGDIPIALWYSNILSAIKTQLVNTVDTANNIWSESYAAAVNSPKAIPDIIAGLYQGMIRGGFEAANVLMKGKLSAVDKIRQQRVLERVRFGQKGGVPINPETFMGRFMKRAFESKLATPLNLWKYPLRAMVASDTVFYHSAKEARSRILARAIGKKEGLSGKALFNRVEEILNRSQETYDDALKQAQKEGLTGLNLRRRVGEIIEQGRDEGLVSAAAEAAEIATYNHEATGVIGLIAHNINNITTAFPLGKAIVPFTNIVANVTNRGLNYTPWGYKRLFFGEWGGKKFGVEAPVDEAFKIQLIKATLGTTAITAVALLDANGTVQVTANGPENIEEKHQLQNAGWKPYSVKIGDIYYSYQYTPFNLGFAAIGHYRDAIRYNKLSEKDASTRLAYGMLKSGSTIFDMSFLSGVSDFIGTVQGQGSSSTKGAGRLFARTATSVLIPNLVKEIDKLFDPTVYQADTITQGLIRETPIARQHLKPLLNVLGEPIAPSQNRFFNHDSKDPVWKLIVEKQAWVPVPSKTSKIGDRPITGDEYYRLIKESGPLIKDYISENLDSLREMTGEEAQDAIRKQSERIRKSVKSGF